MSRSATMILLRDELIGFARSRVMLVLWIVLPVLAVLGYLLIPSGGGVDSPVPGQQMSATAFMGLLLSSIAGTVAALLIAVDIVTERNRKVYDLLVIRPIRREAIIWAKFLAVFGCVTVACVLALSVGLAIDAIRGARFASPTIGDLVETLVSLAGVIALSAAVGALFGVLTRSILVAVILVLYVGQNLAVVPMLPTYLGLMPDHFWLIMLVTLGLTGIVMLAAGFFFRRSQF